MGQEKDLIIYISILSQGHVLYDYKTIKENFSELVKSSLEILPQNHSRYSISSKGWMFVYLFDSKFTYMMMCHEHIKRNRAFEILSKLKSMHNSSSNSVEGYMKHVISSEKATIPPYKELHLYKDAPKAYMIRKEGEEDPDDEPPRKIPGRKSLQEELEELNDDTDSNIVLQPNVDNSNTNSNDSNSINIVNGNIVGSYNNGAPFIRKVKDKTSEDKSGMGVKTMRPVSGVMLPPGFSRQSLDDICIFPSIPGSSSLPNSFVNNDGKPIPVPDKVTSKTQTSYPKKQIFDALKPKRNKTSDKAWSREFSRPEPKEFMNSKGESKESKHPRVDLYSPSRLALGQLPASEIPLPTRPNLGRSSASESTTSKRPGPSYPNFHDLSAPQSLTPIHSPSSSKTGTKHNSLASDSENSSRTNSPMLAKAFIPHSSINISLQKSPRNPSFGSKVDASKARSEELTVTKPIAVHWLSRTGENRRPMSGWPIVKSSEYARVSPEESLRVRIDPKLNLSSKGESRVRGRVETIAPSGLSWEKEINRLLTDGSRSKSVCNPTFITEPDMKKNDPKVNITTGENTVWNKATLPHSLSVGGIVFNQIKQSPNNEGKKSNSTGFTKVPQAFRSIIRYFKGVKKSNGAHHS